MNIYLLAQVEQVEDQFRSYARTYISKGEPLISYNGHSIILTYAFNFGESATTWFDIINTNEAVCIGEIRHTTVWQGVLHHVETEQKYFLQRRR